MPAVDYSCGARCLSATTKSNFAVEATGMLRVPAGSAGAAQFSLTASGRARLYINSRLLVEVSNVPGKSGGLHSFVLFDEGTHPL